MRKAEMLFALAILTATSPTYSNDVSVKELRKDKNIEIHYVTRRTQDVYETIDGHVIYTKNCFLELISREVFLAKTDMLTSDGSGSCEIDRVYRTRLDGGASMSRN